MRRNDLTPIERSGTQRGLALAAALFFTVLLAVGLDQLAALAIEAGPAAATSTLPVLA